MPCIQFFCQRLTIHDRLLAIAHVLAHICLFALYDGLNATIISVFLISMYLSYLRDTACIARNGK